MSETKMKCGGGSTRGVKQFELTGEEQTTTAKRYVMNASRSKRYHIAIETDAEITVKAFERHKLDTPELAIDDVDGNTSWTSSSAVVLVGESFAAELVVEIVATSTAVVDIYANLEGGV